MNRREVITLLSGAAAPSLFWPLAARAQQAGLPRIGVLSGGTADSRSEALKQGLQELGYIAGRNIAIEWRFPADQERTAIDAADLVSQGVNVIVALSSVPAQAARNATSAIPIVFVGVSDPIEQGFIKNLARPGGNMTGLSNTNVELSGKRLEILREALPKIERVAVLINPGNPISQAASRELEGPASTLGIALEPVEAKGAFELGAALVTLMSGPHPDALFVGPSPLFLEQARQIAEFTTRHGLPTMHTNREHVEAGGFMAYGPPLAAMYRRAAAYVDKILKGARPTELPVEQPTTFELVINIRTAKALGLTIPPTLLARADEVIE